MGSERSRSPLVVNIYELPGPLMVSYLGQGRGASTFREKGAIIFR